jgi:hypothetical protein
MTTRRGAPTPIAVAVTVTAITAIGITITIPVVARITPAAVTITVAIVTTLATFSTAVVRITVGGTAMSHVLARSWSVRPIGDGIIDTNSTAVQVL